MDDLRVDLSLYGSLSSLHQCPQCEKNALPQLGSKFSCIWCDFSREMNPKKRSPFLVKRFLSPHINVSRYNRFLPEECAAELGCTQRRLKKKYISPWHIRRQLIYEFACILWGYYLKVQLDNLFLGFKKDHTIDN